MTTTAPTTMTLIERADGSGRWRIVGWMLGTLALALGIVVVVVRSMLIAQVGEQANRDVTQELQEFTSFAEVGVDPATGKRFTSADRLFQTYLSRQQAGSHELILGWVGATDRAYELRGPATPTTEEYDPAHDRELLDRLADTSSGVHRSPAGEFRWGRVVLAGSGNPADALLVGVFTEQAERQARDTVRDLALEDPMHLAEHRLICGEAAQHADRATDRRHRVSELVGQHRQERILACVGLLGDVAQLLRPDRTDHELLVGCTQLGIARFELALQSDRFESRPLLDRANLIT